MFYSEWMAVGPHDSTLTGRIKKPSFKIICEWMTQAWGLISEEIIINTFQKTGISNALDWTENDCVWE
jgi:hypothetical protein